MEDYNFECSMCGKPMSPRYCGMCYECEMIENDVPDDPQLEECVQCGELTRNRFGETESGDTPMCFECEQAYWEGIGDELSRYGDD